MARCELQIELEGGRTEYRAGESVRGSVRVRSDAAVDCGGLTVRGQWGVGPRSRQGGTEEVTLFTGEWPAGSVTSYPFVLELPRVPLSYDGQLVRVDWWVEARARVRGFDPVAKQEISLVADPEAEPDWGGLYQQSSAMHHVAYDVLEEERPGAAPPPATLPRAVQIGCLLLALAPFAVGALLIALSVFLALSGRTTPAEAAIILLVVVAVLTMLGVAAWRLFLGNWLAQRRLGEVRLEVQPVSARGGSEVDVRLMLMPRSRVVLESVRATLEGEERVDPHGEKRRRERKTHTVHRQEVELAGRRELGAGHPLQVEGSVPVPDRPPPSLGFSWYQLNWWLTVRVRVKGGADWEKKRLLLVHP
ncbi:MAG TPA: hypothetical protein VMT16_06575 [Thermoanaerobaculia bacterium]|nr:hypothetical protein [Thermoanaerobaculia bacterium]